MRVFDTGEPGRAASWAGAGMLAPYTEAVDDRAFLDLCAASLAAYPEFVERVREGSGVDPKLRLDGIVNAAFDEKQFEHVSGRVRDLRNAGIACELLDRAETLATGTGARCQRRRRRGRAMRGQRRQPALGPRAARRVRRSRRARLASHVDRRGMRRTARARRSHRSRLRSRERRRQRVRRVGGLARRRSGRLFAARVSG